MITIQKGRTLEIGQSVEIYRNLNSKGKIFSIKDKKTGLVVAHADKFLIKDVVCKVREGGRQRVIREKRKNVHATVIGKYIGENEVETNQLDELYYDPYELDSFVNKRTSERITESTSVYFQEGKAYLKIN